MQKGKITKQNLVWIPMHKKDNSFQKAQICTGNSNRRAHKRETYKEPLQCYTELAPAPGQVA